MRLWFDRLEIESFKAYREPQTLDLKYMGKGLWFIEGRNLVNGGLGSNGAAKSTIWDCVSWVLYGKTVKGAGTVDVKGWGSKTAPEAKVFIACSTGDNGVQVHEVHRKGVANGLWLNGKGVTQDEVERLVGLTHTTFLHTIVLGQGEELFFDLKPAAKMEILSETMLLNKWDDRIARARKRVAEYEASVSRVRGELSQVSRECDDNEIRLRDLKSRSAEWEEDRAREGEITAKKLRELEGWLEDARVDLGKADLAYDGAETELRHSQRKLDEAREDGRKLITARAEASAKYNATRDHEDGCNRAWQGMLRGDTCPVCKQSLDTHAQEDLERELKEALQDAIEDTNKAKRKLDDAIGDDERAKARERQHEVDIRNFRERSNDAIDARTRHQSRVNELANEVHGLKNPPASITVNPYTELLQDLRKVDSKQRAREENLKDDIAALEDKATLAKYWVDGFKNVRLYLIEDLLVELEAVTQTHLASVSMGDWRVEYDIEKETKAGTTRPGISVYIFQPEYDAAIKWELFSGGELQRLRLIGAVSLGEVLLRRAGVECDLLVLDEPTQHLSPEGVRDCVDFLVERARHGQVFYVDHTAQDNRRFEGTVRVVRDREGARFSVQM